VIWSKQEWIPVWGGGRIIFAGLYLGYLAERLRLNHVHILSDFTFSSIKICPRYVLSFFFLVAVSCNGVTFQTLAQLFKTSQRFNLPLDVEPILSFFLVFSLFYLFKLPNLSFSLPF